MFKHNTTKYSIAFLLFFLSLGVFAQNETFKPYMGLGVHGGVNFATVRFDEILRDTTISYSNVQRYSGGFMLKFMAESYAGVLTEFNFSQRGWKEIKSGSYTYTRKTSYLEVPVLTHLIFGKKRFRYIINVGPYMGFYRNYTESFDMDVPGTPEPPASDSLYFYKEPDRDFDFGFMADLSFGVNTSVGLFQLKARYSFGLANMYEPYKNNFRYSNAQNIYVGVVYMRNIYFRRDD